MLQSQRDTEPRDDLPDLSHGAPPEEQDTETICAQLEQTRTRRDTKQREAAEAQAKRKSKAAAKKSQVKLPKAPIHDEDKEDEDEDEMQAALDEQDEEMKAERAGG